MSGVLGDRRALLADLTRALAPGSPDRVLAVFRLHGLRDLTDRSGTDAGGALLEVGAERLVSGVGPSGRCYRPRRDEWCVLLDGPLTSAIRALDSVTVELNATGGEYGVSVEAGVALLPEEAEDPISALERADLRVPPDPRTGPRQRRTAERRSRRGES